MLLADYYTRTATMWFFLAVGTACLIVWGIAAAVKGRRRAVARANAKLELHPREKHR